MGRTHLQIVGICIFIKFITIHRIRKNKRNYPYKKKIHPISHNIQLVWHYQFSIVFAELQEKYVGVIHE